MKHRSKTVWRSESRYTCDASIRDHHLIIDEPISEGGFDAGPTPVELVTAALGSCTAITMQMYANRKGWPITRLEVTVDHDLINDPEAALEGRTVKRDRFETIILLEGDFDEQQRERILDIARRCPVHRIIAGSAIMTQTVIDAADSLADLDS